VTGPGSIRHPIILPSITTDLQKKIGRYHIIKSSEELYSILGCTFVSCNKSVADKIGLLKFCSSIVAANPAFADSGGSCVMYIYVFYHYFCSTFDFYYHFCNIFIF